jgi:hypothetical protein
MNPREEILTILNGNKPEKVPWFGDLDYYATSLIARGIKPDNFRETKDYIQWHKDLGVGFYLQGFFPMKEIKDYQEKTWKKDFCRFREITTPKGILRECWEYIPSSFTEAPVEHLVKSENDLPAIRYVYEHTDWEPDYEYAYKRMEQIGDQGILLCYLPKSPFMQMLVLDSSIMSVTFIENNEPEEFLETLNIMKVSFDKAAEISVKSPAEALMIPENLSSEMVGPRYFEKYMRSYQEEWINKIKQAGKFSFIHMDGTLKGLLKQEASKGFNVIEAMTPKPVGDLEINDWASTVDNTKTIFWGGIPGSYFTPNVDDNEFDRHVIKALSIMKKEPRYVLGVADQVPPDGMEYRIRRVKELVEKNGCYD